MKNAYLVTVLFIIVFLFSACTSKSSAFQPINSKNISISDSDHGAVLSGSLMLGCQTPCTAIAFPVSGKPIKRILIVKRHRQTASRSTERKGLPQLHEHFPVVAEAAHERAFLRVPGLNTWRPLKIHDHLPRPPPPAGPCRGG